MKHDPNPVASDAIRILITDDDAGDRMAIRRALKNTELLVECTEAATIDEALAARERRPFDC